MVAHSRLFLVTLTAHSVVLSVLRVLLWLLGGGTFVVFLQPTQLLLELKLRGDYANVLDAYPAPRRASSKQRHNSSSSSSSARAAAAAANERSPARRAVEAWLKELSNGSFVFTPEGGLLGSSHRGGGGGAAEDGDDGDVEEDPPLPQGLSALPLELTWDLVSGGGSAALVAALLQGLKVSDSVSLLLEFHRRYAAGPILDYLGQTMPGYCTSMTVECIASGASLHFFFVFVHRLRAFVCTFLLHSFVDVFPPSHAHSQRRRCALSKMLARHGPFPATRHGRRSEGPRARVLADRCPGGVLGGHGPRRPERNSRGKIQSTCVVSGWVKLGELFACLFSYLQCFLV